MEFTHCSFETRIRCASRCVWVAVGPCPRCQRDHSKCLLRNLATCAHSSRVSSPNRPPPATFLNVFPDPTGRCEGTALPPCASKATQQHCHHHCPQVDRVGKYSRDSFFTAATKLSRRLHPHLSWPFAVAGETPLLAKFSQTKSLKNQTVLVQLTRKLTLD